LGDEPLVGVGGVAEGLAASRTLLQRQVDGLVDSIGSASSVGNMAGLAAGSAALRTGFGGSSRTVELLGGRGGDVEGGGVLPKSVEFLLALGDFPIARTELISEGRILRFELLESSEDLEALLAGESDRTVVFGSKKKSGVPSGHDALG
ncbi:MAG: hypothetical protein ACREDE_04450, partial [Thermoplasmata archaeon]